MSEQRPGPPADMLLLRERQRRLHAQTQTQASPIKSGVLADDAVLLEPDALVDETAIADPQAGAAGSIALFRPLTHVSLSRIAWSGAVDHETLQNALVCAPPRDASGARAPSWLAAVSTFALERAPRDEPSLHVTLGADDAAVLARVGMRVAQADAMSLVRAAALPASIVGTDAVTVSAATGLLAGYRHASLVHAWQAALSGSASPDAARERDAAAVQLISVLRALLGEA